MRTCAANLPPQKVTIKNYLQTNTCMLLAGQGGGVPSPLALLQALKNVKIKHFVKLCYK